MNNNKIQALKNTISRDQERKVMQKFFDKVETQEIISINENLLRFLVLNNLNFNIVESPSFVNFIHKLRPAFQLPSVFDLSNNILDSLYNDCAKNVSFNCTGVLYVYAKENELVSMICNAERHYFFIKVSLNEPDFNRFVSDSISVLKNEHNQKIHSIIANYIEQLNWKVDFNGCKLWYFSCISMQLEKLSHSTFNLDFSTKLIEIYDSIETNIFNKKSSTDAGDIKYDSFVKCYNIVSHCKSNLKRLCQLAVDERSKVKTNIISLLFDDIFEKELDDVHTIFHFLCEICDKLEYTLADFVEDYFILNEKLITGLYKKIVFDNLQNLLTPIALASNFLHPFYRGKKFMSDTESSSKVFEFFIDELDEAQMSEMHDYNTNEGIFLKLNEKNYKNAKVYWSIIQRYKPGFANFSLKLLSVPAFTKRNNFNFIQNESLPIVQQIKMKKLFFALKINE